MKLTEKTIDVLTNFNDINSTICINEGNVIKTISPSSTIIANAEVDMEFDTGFCLHNISRFLNALNLMKTKDIEVNDKFIVIQNGKSRIDYMRASKSIIKAAPEKFIEMPDDCICNFFIKDESIQQLLKAMAILTLPEIAIIGEGGRLKFKGVDSDGKVQDSYSLDIGETNKTFKVIINTANFSKIMPGDYQVRVAKIKNMYVSSFKNEADKVEYFIAIDRTSDV
jgi:hypothetical protein